MTSLLYCLPGILLCLWQQGFSQSIERHIAPLTIGDTIPGDLAFSPVYNYPRSKIQLSALRGKATIVDIWGTYCAPCVADLPKLDRIQRQFSDGLQIIAVSQESSSTIRHFLEASQYAKSLSFPLAAEDVLLPRYFPLNSIPQQIWIDSDGVIKAITGDEQMDSSNIQRLIRRERMNLPLKKDFIEFNPALPLLQNLAAGPASVIYQTVFTRHQPGIGTRTSMSVDTVAKTRRIVFYNTIVASLYQAAMGGIELNRVVLDGVNEDWFYYKRSKVKQAEGLYCLEISLPSDKSLTEANKVMLQELNRGLALTTKFEELAVPVYVLKRIEPFTEPTAAGIGRPHHNLYNLSAPVKELRNEPISVFIDFLNGRFPSASGAPIFLNESDYWKGIDMNLPIADYKDIASIKKALRVYGFDLEQERRTVRMLVISKAD